MTRSDWAVFLAVLGAGLSVGVSTLGILAGAVAAACVATVPAVLGPPDVRRRTFPVAAFFGALALVVAAAALASG